MLNTVSAAPRKKGGLRLWKAQRLVVLDRLAPEIAQQVSRLATFAQSDLTVLQSYFCDLLGLLKQTESAVYQVVSGEDPASVLRGLTHYRETVERDSVLADLHQALKGMRERTDRIREIARALDELLQLDAGRPEPIELNECIRGALRLCAGKLHPHMRIQCNLGALPLIQGCSVQLTHVFLNLILHSERTLGDRGTLSIATHAESDRVVALMKDTGYGASTESLEQIFDPWHTLTSEEGGSGLGLFVAREVVRDHGGEILVQSRQGEGTEYRVDLPLQEIPPTA